MHEQSKLIAAKNEDYDLAKQHKYHVERLKSLIASVDPIKVHPALLDETETAISHASIFTDLS